MNRKVRNLFRYLILITPFACVLFSIFRTGDIVSAVETVGLAMADIVDYSVFSPLYHSLDVIIEAKPLIIIIFGTFVLYAYYEIVDIMIDVIMFLPRFLDKCMDNLGKERD